MSNTDKLEALLEQRHAKRLQLRTDLQQRRERRSATDELHLAMAIRRTRNEIARLDREITWLTNPDGGDVA